MNRQIRFRGKTSEGLWVYGSLIIDPISRACYIWEMIVAEDGSRDFEQYSVIPESVGEYTGLNDRNGKEVYEGDICEGHSDGNGIIKWTDFDGGYDYIFSDEGNVGIWEVKNDLIIIGNITDNPELLPNE